MKHLVDLHLHSNVIGSDGTMSPHELIEYIYSYSIDLGIDSKSLTISLTDHNVTTGLVPAQDKANEYGMNFIPGCEVMVYEADYDVQIEILIYGRLERILSEEFQEFIARSRKALERKIKTQIERWYRNGLIIDGLRVDMPDSLYGELMSARLTNDYDFFVRYIKPRIDKSVGKAFQQDVATRIFYEQMRHKQGQLYVALGECGFPSPESLLSLSKELGFITSLAHPGEYEIAQDKLLELIEKLVERGLRGIEVYSRKNPDKLINYLSEYCSRKSLLLTGGSDFHGSRETCKIGMYSSEKYIPYNVVFSANIGI